MLLPPSLVSAAARRAQMGVTKTVNFNQRGEGWIKPVSERPVFTVGLEQEKKLRRRTDVVREAQFFMLLLFSHLPP